MSDIRDFCPLWGEWEVESKIGEGSFGTVWKIKRNVLGGKVYYAAVKHISIPKDESEIDRLIGEGVFSDEQSANHYYNHMLQSIADEIDAMHKLQGYTNIVAYEDHKIIPKGDGVGYDLFLRMELLKPLTERIRQGMRIQDVTALGKDIATAISVLSDHNMIHRDIKPQNIFINDKEIYKLGDYGTARALGTGATAMSRKGTYNYMSPEIYNNQKADIRADIYSLGLVLYRLLNGNRLPFLPIGKQITSEDSDVAVMRRISGEKIDPPKYADNELSDIVLKACAFDPDDRYRSPEEMISDLDKYRINNNDHIQSDDQDKTVYDSHVYSFGDSNKKADTSMSIETKQASHHEPGQAKVDINIDEKTVAEPESAPASIPRTRENIANGPKVNQGNGNNEEKKSDQSTKKKWLIPLAALLSIVLIAGGLWASGIILPKPPHPTSEPDVLSSIETPVSTIEEEPVDKLIATSVKQINEKNIKTHSESSDNRTTETLDMDSSEELTDTQTKNTTNVPSQEPLNTLASESENQLTTDQTHSTNSTYTTSYTITWIIGSETDTTSVSSGETPTHSDPVKSSDAQYTYTFKGWSPDIKEATQDATYKAIFQENIRSYTITWLDDTGKTIGTTPVAYGDMPFHTKPTKASNQQYTYSFSAWQPEVQQVTGDATYKATFKSTLRTYTITWQDDTNKTIGTTPVAYGDMPFHTDPTKASDQQYTYSFSGWRPEIQAVTGDVTYQATFNSTPRTYTITWQDDTGKAIGYTLAAYGSVPTYSNPTKESDEKYSYTFVKWRPSPTPVTGDTTYKAYFKRHLIPYTATWLDDTGKIIDTTTVLYGTKPSHSDPTKESSDPQYSYVFSGWDPKIQPITGDRTYKATFKQTKKSYTITWLDDTGEIIETTTVEYGKWPTHLNPSKEPDQQYTYLFSGWEPKTTKVSGDATYKATYKAKEIITPGLGWVCPNCQSENSSDNIFCTNCGQALCLECGNTIPRGDKFCSNCGTELGKWNCSECHTAQNANDVFCSNCGTKRHKPESQ